MAKSKHTSAPWQDPVVVYDDPENGAHPIRINVFGNGTDIVHTADLRQPGLPFQTRLANAKIISAAEDMRMALIEILATAQSTSPEQTAAYAKGRAALLRTGVK